MDVKNIFKAVRPLSRRIHLNNAFLCWTYAFILAGVLSLILSITALFFPITYVETKLIGIYSGIILVALAASLFLGPKPQKTIKIGDSLGLKERLVTAYQLQHEDSPIAKMQREDALRAVSNANFKALYPIRIPTLKIFIGITILLMVLVTLIIPTGAREKADEAEGIINETKNQVKKLDEERKGIEKSSMLSDKKLNELNKEVDQLLKDLNSSKDEEDALKSLSKARHELDKLKNSEANKDLQKISEKLSGNKLAKDLSDALKNGDAEGIKDAIEDIKEKLESAQKKDVDELAEHFKEAAGEVSDSKLSEDLTALSDAMKSENNDSIENNLDALAKDLENSVENGAGSLTAAQQSENNSIDRLIQAINSSKYEISKQAGMNVNIAQSSGQQAGNQSGDGQSGVGLQGNQSGQQGASGQSGNQSGNSGQGSQSGQNGEGGQGGQGEQSGQGGQSGKGNQNGSGNSGNQGGGSGSGNGGNGGAGKGGGAGNGSTNEDAGYSEGGSSGAGKKPGGKNEEEYEAIYDPKRLGGNSETSQVNGTKSGSGQSQWTDVKSVPLGEGGIVPYNEVYEEYRDEAMAGLGEAQIPSGMKDLVRDYFSTLE